MFDKVKRKSDSMFRTGGHWCGNVIFATNQVADEYEKNVAYQDFCGIY